MADNHHNKGVKLPPEPLTTAEVRALLAACSNRAPTGIRNRALLVVLWRAGLRCSEALDLRPKDLDSQLGTIRVLHGKGGRSRTLGLDPEAFAVVDRWLQRRRTLDLPKSAPVFCTLDGGPLLPHYVRALCKRLAKRAGIEKRVHPHGFRHTHAYELAEEGAPLHLVQLQLGHSSLSVTDRYVSHLNPAELVERMQQRSWA